MSASIFNGEYIKLLKDKMKFASGTEIVTGTVDPTSVAVSAPIGSIYINTSTGRHYEKIDSGSSTNWKLWITSAEGETLNAPIISTTVPGSPSNGQMWFANNVLNVKYPGGTLQVGEESYIEVINKTGSQINDGQVIYISGSDSGYPKAILARADAFATHFAVAMATNNIPIDGVSNVTTEGIVYDLNTNVDSEGNTVTAGDDIYLSATVAGGWTVIEPIAPYYSLRIGQVLVKDATVGAIHIDIQRNNARDIALVTKEPTGFDVPENVTLIYNSVNQTITIAGTNWTAYWRGKTVPQIYTGVVPVAHTNTVGHTYLLYWDGTGVNDGFNWATDSFPGFDKLLIAYVYYHTADKFALRECHGLTQWNVHAWQHETLGAFRSSGGSLTAGTYVVNPTAGTHTTAQNTWGVDVAVIKDEDLPTTIPAWTEGTYTLAYRSGAAGDWVFDTTSVVPYFVSGGDLIQYNQYTGATWQLTDVTEDFFFNTYIFFVPVTSDSNSQKYRAIVVPGQTITSTLAGAQLLSTLNLSLGNLTSIFTESFPYVKITWLKNASGVGAYPVGVSGRCAIVDVTYNSGTAKQLILASGLSLGDHTLLSNRTAADQHPATSISTTVTNFDVILSASDTTVQAALETLDEYAKSGNFKIQDSTDATKLIKFTCNNQNPSTTLTVESRVTANRTHTVYDTGQNRVFMLCDSLAANVWTFSEVISITSVKGINLAGSTTANRDNTVNFRKNSDLDTFEFYQNSVWTSLPFAAAITTSAGSNTIFTPPTSTVSYVAQVYILDGTTYSLVTLNAILKNATWEHSWTYVGSNPPGTIAVNTSTGVFTYTSIGSGTVKIKADFINF